MPFTIFVYQICGWYEKRQNGSPVFISDVVRLVNMHRPGRRRLTGHTHTTSKVVRLVICRFSPEFSYKKVSTFFSKFSHHSQASPPLHLGLDREPDLRLDPRQRRRRRRLQHDELQKGLTSLQLHHHSPKAKKRLKQKKNLESSPKVKPTQKLARIQTLFFDSIGLHIQAEKTQFSSYFFKCHR